jgi:hypothetical protein
VAQPIEQAPAWVRQLLPSREEREAQHAEAQAGHQGRRPVPRYERRGAVQGDGRPS